jgi:hypothetical protein
MNQIGQWERHPMATKRTASGFARILERRVFKDDRVFEYPRNRRSGMKAYASPIVAVRTVYSIEYRDSGSEACFENCQSGNLPFWESISMIMRSRIGHIGSHLQR